MTAENEGPDASPRGRTTPGHDLAASVLKPVRTKNDLPGRRELLYLSESVCRSSQTSGAGLCEIWGGTTLHDEVVAGTNLPPRLTTLFASLALSISLKGAQDHAETGPD